MSRAVFFISEAFRALRRSAAPSIAAIVTIVVTTLLLGVLIPVLKASGDKAQDVRDQIGLNVFLYNDAARGEIDALGAELETLPHVESVDFVSRKEAVEILAGRVEGELSDSLEPAELEPAAAVVCDRHRQPHQPGRRHRRDHQDRPGTGDRQPISPIVDEVRDARQDASKITRVTGASDRRARDPRRAPPDRLADACRQHDPPLDLRPPA